MKMYYWQVSHPDYQTIKVLAEDIFGAIYKAAVIWNAQFTKVAKDCDAVKLRPAD